MNIGIAPIGSSIKLKLSSCKKTDGSIEYYIFTKILLQYKDIDKIFLLTKNDWSRISSFEKKKLDPKNKIVDCYNGLKYKTETSEEEKLKQNEDFYNKVSKERIDFIIGFMSQGYSRACIPLTVPSSRDSSKFLKQLCMTYNYASFPLYFINKSKIPWICISTDARYFNKKFLDLYDTTNLPLEFTAMYNNKYIVRHIKSFEDKTLIDQVVPMNYEHLEKIYGFENKPVEHLEKTKKFIIVAMQINQDYKKDNRFNALKEWLIDLDDKNEIEIYGRWNEEVIKKYSQFKGLLSFEELNEKWKQTKYTLIIPTGKYWATMKHLEIILFDVVPFMHPDYDSQFNVVPKDHFIRVNSSKEFFDKMEYLDNNEDIRKNLIKELKVLFLKDSYNGDFLIDILNKKFNAGKLDFFISKQREEEKTFDFLGDFQE